MTSRTVGLVGITASLGTRPVARLLERVRLLAVEAEAQVQDGPQAWVQALESVR
jgi:hypothetical protein